MDKLKEIGEELHKLHANISLSEFCKICIDLLKSYEINEGLESLCILTNKDAVDYRIFQGKQNPKKPNISKSETDTHIDGGIWGAGVTLFHCGYCNRLISRVYKYCPDCGQALDWSVSDE